jgi:hypothetical protein
VETEDEEKAKSGINFQEERCFCETNLRRTLIARDLCILRVGKFGPFLAVFDLFLALLGAKKPD